MEIPDEWLLDCNEHLLECYCANHGGTEDVNQVNDTVGIYCPGCALEDWFDAMGAR